MIDGKYVAVTNNSPVIVTMRGGQIVEVMKPDGYKYKPTNPRHLKRLKGQAPE